MSGSLLLHSESRTVSREDLFGMPVGVEQTSTFTPVPHSKFVESVEESIEKAGFAIRESEYALWRRGERFFGVITLDSTEDGRDYSTTIGLRNANDKSAAAAIALGCRVTVCDNLAFLSEVVIKTRHTSKILERLNGLVATGVGRLIEHRALQDKRIDVYKTTPVENHRHLHDLVIRAYRAGAIPSTAIAKVVEEFENPRHDEFRSWTLWSLMNATTETLKNYSDIQKRTQRLHGVFDTEVGGKVLAV